MPLLLSLKIVAMCKDNKSTIMMTFLPNSLIHLAELIWGCFFLFLTEIQIKSTISPFKPKIYQGLSPHNLAIICLTCKSSPELWPKLYL